MSVKVPPRSMENRNLLDDMPLRGGDRHFFRPLGSKFRLLSYGLSLRQHPCCLLSCIGLLRLQRAPSRGRDKLRSRTLAVAASLLGMKRNPSPSSYPTLFTLLYHLRSINSALVMPLILIDRPTSPNARASSPKRSHGNIAIQAALLSRRTIASAEVNYTSNL